MNVVASAAVQRLLRLLRRRPQQEDAPQRCSIEEFISFSSSRETPFDVLVAPNDTRWDDLFPHSLLLSRSALTELYNGLGRVGPFSAHKGGRVAQCTAKRIANRLATKACGADKAKQSAFSKAWLFPIWREIATLMPVRALARKLAQSHAGKLIVIPIETNVFSYLNYFKWDVQADEIEPLLLATACRQAGMDVIVVAERSVFTSSATSANEIAIEIRPYENWREQGRPIISGQQCNNIVVEDGIRNFEYVKTQIPDAISVKSRLYSGSEQAQIILWGQEHNPPTHIVSLKLVKELPGEVALYSPADEVSTLSDYFIASMLPMTEAAMQTAIESVNTSGVKDAHICDCYFFESALIAHAVRQNGGRVHLWPHSINNTFILQHSRADSPATVRSITSSSARKCAEYFRTSNVIIDPRIMLAPAALPRRFVENRPTTVVIFGGSHAVARMPLLDVRHHEQTWVKLLKALGRYPDEFKVIFKPKGHWESSHWLSSLSGGSLKFVETAVHANDLDFDNSIFMSVSLASAALLEGLGRGIPFMITREVEVEDYMHVDPGAVPIGPVDSIVSHLLELRAPHKFISFAEKQLRWYSQEVTFNKSALERETYQ